MTAISLDDECRHGIAAATCSYCRTEALRTTIRRGQVPAGVFAMEAGFDSRCPGCGGFIGAGERIYRPRSADAFECESCLLYDLRRP